VKREPSSPPLSLTLANSGKAYEKQIVDQIPKLIQTRAIPPGAPLPPARQLASDLLVSPGTVRRAYKRLEAEGLVVFRSVGDPVVVRDADDLLRQRRLARRRNTLARAIADLRQLAPAGCDDLEVEAEHLRRAIEVDQARTMQRSLLPRAAPVIENLDIAVSMSTASEVGGDYYDFFERPDGGLRAVIGDATGHGLAAGIMAAMTKACLTAISAEAPETMMSRANEVLRAVRGTRVMMALGILDIDEEQATICSAGMPPVFVLRRQPVEVEEVSLQSPPLGSSLTDTFPCRTLPFGPGDALVAISDGLLEIRNSSGEALGAAALRSWLAVHIEVTAHEIVEGLTRLASVWSPDSAPEDDMTVMVVKHQGDTPS
jgi:serine phosphatase RsbU (regulator of sigma subunit)